MDDGSYQSAMTFRLYWIYFSKTDIKVILSMLEITSFTTKHRTNVNLGICKGVRSLST